MSLYGGVPQWYLRRTADSSLWFHLGQTYQNPYGFRVRVAAVTPPSPIDNRWYLVLEFVASPGSPAVGALSRVELYAPRGAWWPVP
jgi:hypothetical protein